jgi:predicted Rdx family selenoprotein
VAGSYQLGLWARSSGNTTDAPEGNAAAVLAYTITGPVPPTITGLSANLASPQAVGTALSLSATVTGGTSPQQCKWLVTTDPTWATYTTLRTWAACTTPAPWTPSVAGTYQLGLWARSSGNTVDYPEASAVLSYRITPPTVTVTATPPAPQRVGTPLAFSATVSGGTAPHQCKWLVATDPSWATYTVLREWQACTTPAPWTPTAPWTYQVGVWARSAGNTVDAPEASAALPYTVTPMTVTVTASPAAPQVAGSALTLTATVTGGTAPQQCKWFATTDPTWATYTILRTWQACTSPVSWTPTSGGSYVVAVWARSSGSTADAPEAGAGLAYEILFNLAGNWNYAESGSVTYTITALGETETDTQPVSGSGIVTVVQHLTNVSWTPPGTSYARRGTITGNYVQVSGIGCAALLGADVTFTENVSTAQGTVSADGRRMTLTGSTSCQGTGTYEGIPFTFRASGWSTVTMTR